MIMIIGQPARKDRENSMKAFFTWLFSQNNSALKIGLFDAWHFLYLFVIFGGTLALSLIGRKFPGRKNRLQNMMAYLTIGLYLIDFFHHAPVRQLQRYQRL